MQEFLMDGPVAFAKVRADELICKERSPSKSCHKESCRENVKCAPGCMDKNVKCPLPLDASSILEKDVLMVEVLGIALKGFLHIHDTHELLPGSTTSSNEAFSHSEVLPTDVLVDSMNGSESSVAARGSMMDSQSLTKEKDEIASLQSDSTKYQEEVAVCITPLLTNATPMEHIPALKGSREKQGMPPKGKLSVKWAPEVYDPPVTSASHTVRGYRHRSKVRKDHHKHKYVKGRSSRGSSSSDKKHAKTKRTTYGLTDFRIIRCRDPSVDKLNMNAFEQQNAEIGGSGMEW